MPPMFPSDRLYAVSMGKVIFSKKKYLRINVHTLYRGVFMNGFCGAFNLSRDSVNFSVLRRIRNSQGDGCAFVNKEFGILCDGVLLDVGAEQLQPTTVRYNNALYTSAIIMDKAAVELEASTSSALLEGYLEEGERYFSRLDFAYALVMYDGRCGELMLRKGYRGDKPLFYTLRDSTLYFSTSLQSILKLYGGCVKVNKKALDRFIFDAAPMRPQNLFYNISFLGVGEMLICSSFGYDVVSKDCTVGLVRGNIQRVLPHVAYTKAVDMGKILTDALFVFGYPQFDCYMPLLMRAVNITDKGMVYGLDDPLYDQYPAYSVYRAEHLGMAYGVDIYPMSGEKSRLSGRELRAMDKAIDKLLYENQDEVERLFESDQIESMKNEKNIPLRIRRKGMIYQSVIWQKHFNVVFD